MNRAHVERGVLEVLVVQSPLHVMEISDRTNEHPVTVDLACARLHDNGDIVSVGLGRYDITELGQRRRDELLADQPPERPTS